MEWKKEASSSRFRVRIAWMSSGDGTLGQGFRLLPVDEYSSRYLRFLSRLWNFNSVDGRLMTVARRMRRGLRTVSRNLTGIGRVPRDWVHVAVTD